MMTSGEIRKLRKKLGLTQLRFAVKVGVSLGTVAHWEQGQCSPSPLAAERIRQVAEQHGVVLPVR